MERIMKQVSVDNLRENDILALPILSQADAEVYFPEFDKSLYTKTILSDIEENGIHYQHVEYTLK